MTYEMQHTYMCYNQCQLHHVSLNVIIVTNVQMKHRTGIESTNSAIPKRYNKYPKCSRLSRMYALGLTRQSVCTSRYSTEMAKSKNNATRQPRDSIFGAENIGKTQTGSPQRRALPMQSNGQTTWAPCAVERDVRSGPGSIRASARVRPPTKKNYFK